MPSIRTSSIALTFLALGAITANAQDRGPREHKGIWVSFGIGGGLNASQGLDDETRAGVAGFLRLGGSVSQQLLVGGETNGWLRSEGDTDFTRGNVTLVVMYYPSRQGGLYVKGGVGFSSLKVEQEVVLGGRVFTTEDTKEGFGTTIGAGYDIRLARNFYLSPTVDWLFQAFGETENGTTTNNLILISLGFTWH